MSHLPTLPSGYSAQVVWRVQHGLRTYELFHVYDAAQRLDEARSFWLSTPLDRGDAPPVRSVSWRRHRLLSPKPGSFAAFSRPSVPLELLDRWLDEGPPDSARHPRPALPARAA